jgi:predicted Zn finger-like uncharacterized protein
MRFACHKCHAQYSVEDDRIHGKIVKFRCKKCDQVILLQEGGPAPAPPQAAAERPIWFAGLDGEEQGPFTLSELRQALGAGRLGADHFYWREGLEDWAPLDEVPELARLIPGAGKQAELEREQAQQRLRAERQRAAELDREQALQRRRDAERQAVERQAAARQALLCQAEREAELATAALGRVDTGKFSSLDARGPDATLADPGGGGGSKSAGRSEIRAQRVDESDEERQKLVDRAIKRRAKARVERHEDRVAEEFFSLSPEEQAAALPLPPVSEEPAELARRLHAESIEEEYRLLQSDPEAVRRRREAEGEISQVLRQQAKVKSQRRRLGLALSAVGGVVLAVGGLLALGLGLGWFDGFSGLGLGPGASQELELPSTLTADLTPEEALRLRERLLAIKKGRTGKKPAGRGGGARPARDSGAEALAEVLGERKGPLTREQRALVDFYRDQAEVRPDSPVLKARPGLELAAAGIAWPGQVGLEVGGGDPTAAKPEVVPEGPDAKAGPERLTELQIRAVVQRNRVQVKQCLERQLKKDTSVSGKLDLRVRIQPDGKVESVAVDTPRFRGSYLEECLIQRVQRWTFPRFAGEPYELKLPLLLTAQESF